ncbi:hypothetical protein NMY22_g353 [Coprinellus aureogranulatus]|nr:hypothetical protein NMY22_g353 [Coprinellus aureogranulatus]
MWSFLSVSPSACVCLGRSGSSSFATQRERSGLSEASTPDVKDSSGIGSSESSLRDQNNPTAAPNLLLGFDGDPF